MSLPDVITIDRDRNAWRGLWIPNPVRAKCGKCGHGTFYYDKPLPKKCRVCKLQVKYIYPGFWKGLK